MSPSLFTTTFESSEMMLSHATSSSIAKRALFRTGMILKDIATPCYLPTSVVGNVPHLTPDNCKKLPDLKAQIVDFADM